MTELAFDLGPWSPHESSPIVEVSPAKKLRVARGVSIIAIWDEVERIGHRLSVLGPASTVSPELAELLGIHELLLSETIVD